MKNVSRPEKDLVNSFVGIGTATIHESVGKEINNVMDNAIKPLKRGTELVGPAITVDSFPADNLTVHVAMTLCKPGDVLVVNGHGSIGVMFGAQMAFQAMQHGIAGIVVDGAVRDSEELRNMGFPCFARYISPLGSAKSTPGSVNVPIQCGGVIVNPGDLIVGDDDGVVVVAKDTAGEVVKRAKARDEKEAKTRELFRQGKTSMELNNYEKILKEKGVREVERLEDL